MIVSCGCSISYGYGIDSPDENSFSSIVAKEKNHKFISLAKPACSNYCIVKQIEYAIDNYSPQTIIINTTYYNRIDWISNNLNQKKISYLNFHLGEILSVSEPTIESYVNNTKTIFNEFVNNLLKNQNKKDLQTLIKYIKDYQNEHIENDKSRLMFSSVLNNNNIDFIILDDFSIINHNRSNIKIIKNKLLPTIAKHNVDGRHLDITGHQKIAQEILKYLN